jgi:hypothetical protein
MQHLNVVSCLCVVLVAAGLAGCATGTTPADSAGYAVPGVTTTRQAPAEFVRESRGEAPSGYIPVGITPPPRVEPRRDAATLKKLEDQLDAQRNRSRTYAARPRPASAYTGPTPPRPAPPAAE